MSAAANSEPVLKGLMQDVPLMISSLLEFAAKQHPSVELVTRTVEDPNVYHRTTYGTVLQRVKKLSNVLRDRFGVKPGDRIATLAWNTVRHFELFHAVSGIGAVLHTLNPRLYVEQLVYIINHAADSIIFVDVTLLKLIEQLRPHINCKRFVVMTDEPHMPASCKPLSLNLVDCAPAAPFRALCYEQLIESERGRTDWAWPTFDERTASSLCYTSGTTGNPKAVLYSHRSTILHSMMVCQRDGLGLSSHDSIFLIVPMFHANAWGICYAAPMCGAKLVFPGEHLAGPDIYHQLVREKITFTCGVPTVWLALFAHIDSLIAADKKGAMKAADGRTKYLPDLQRVGIGGSACPPAMIKRFYCEFAQPIIILHIWGMTELSPLGSVGNLLPKHFRSSKNPSQPSTIDEKVSAMSKQGRFVYGVEAEILDDECKALPRDGTAFGNLVVRGPWIASGYYKDEKASKSLMTGVTGESVAGDGSQPRPWMITGDVATIDSDGFMAITDRSKDVIKSGGEWISSIDIENAAVGHPSVAEAAVIGIAHPKWQERPLLLVVRKSGAQHAKVTKGEILTFLKSKMISWWLPDDIVFTDSLPHTATGKLLKTKLREQFKDHLMPEVNHAPIRSAL